MKYKAILFDLDGTLFNTEEGIIYSMLRSLDYLGVAHPSKELHRRFIGPPIDEIYRDLCKVSDDNDIKRAFEFYKKDYAEFGANFSKPYEGLTEALISLKEKGYLIAVATFKHQSYAPVVIRDNGIYEYFDFIAGSDEASGRDSKAKIITYAAQNLGVNISECIMIGDSPFDALGAVMAGCDFGAVTYGFGFDDEPHCRRYPAKAVFHNMKEIENWF